MHYEHGEIILLRISPSLIWWSNDMGLIGWTMFSIVVTLRVRLGMQVLPPGTGLCRTFLLPERRRRKVKDSC